MWDLKRFANNMRSWLGLPSRDESSTQQESSQLIPETESSALSSLEFLERAQARFQAEGKLPADLLQEFFKQLTKDAKAVGNQETEFRTKLYTMILPGIMGEIDNGRFTPVQDRCRDWAFACAHLIGIMAGLTIKENAIDKAIDEAATSAKDSAHSLCKALEAHDVNAKPQQKPQRIADNADKDQVSAMVSDLLKQAATEKDPAAAAALRAMAESLIKGLKRGEAA